MEARGCERIDRESVLSRDARRPTDLAITPPMHLRKATGDDQPALHHLMQLSVGTLLESHYNAREIRSALRYGFTLDTALIRRIDLYVAEVNSTILGCGGWCSTWRMQNDGQTASVRQLHQGITASDSAVVRSVFVHPDFSRRGTGRTLMRFIEARAGDAGFRKLELVSTLTAVPLYRACGFTAVGSIELTLPDGISLPAVRMEKLIGAHD